MSTSPSQERKHSLAYMQKCDNKDVCVKRGIGLTPVPPVALPSSPLPPASSWLCRQGASERPGNNHLCQRGTSPLPRDNSSLWKTPDLASCCPCKEKVWKLPVRLLTLALKCTQLLPGRAYSESPARAYPPCSFFSVRFARVAA